MSAPHVSYQPRSFAVPSRRSPLKWVLVASGLFIALVVIIGAGIAIKFGMDRLNQPVETVTTSEVDLRGTWSGTYGPLGSPTKLIIKNHDDDKLDGTLEQGAFRIAFRGTYDSEAKTLTMKQTEVLSGDGWSLGEDSGKLSDDGKKITGTGKDALGGALGMTYEWSFTRK